MNNGRLLVVDDEESQRILLNDYFTAAGYEVAQACDGKDALNRFTPNKFDCIISDIFMPSIDGMELLKRIKLLDDQVLFLMITGKPDIDNAVEAIKQGAFDYITKPFHMEDIKLKVERAIHVKKTEASLKKIKGLILTLILLMPILISLGIIFGISWKGE